MKYEVEVPIIGYYWCEIEAQDEETAKQKAMDLFSNLESIDQILEDYELVELNPMEEIVEGNVFHGSLNKIDVVEIK